MILGMHGSSLKKKASDIFHVMARWLTNDSASFTLFELQYGASFTVTLQYSTGKRTRSYNYISHVVGCESKDIMGTTPSSEKCVP